MNVKDAKIYAKKILMPIRDKILGVTSGTHEWRIWDKTGNDITLDLAMYLDIEDKYDMKGIVGSIKVCDISYTFYIKHGSGGGKTQAYKMRKLKEMALVIKNADMYFMSHIHDTLTFQIKPKFIDIETQAITELKQTFISSSSYLKYGGYAEEFDFEPAKTGSPRVRLNGKAKDVHVSI
jgi:hypothetical protein